MMMTWPRAGLPVLLFAVLLVNACASLPAGLRAEYRIVTHAALEQEAIQLINQYRTEHELRPFDVDDSEIHDYARRNSLTLAKNLDPREDLEWRAKWLCRTVQCQSDMPEHFGSQFLGDDSRETLRHIMATFLARPAVQADLLGDYTALGVGISEGADGVLHVSLVTVKPRPRNFWEGEKPREEAI